MHGVFLRGAKPVIAMGGEDEKNAKNLAQWIKMCTFARKIRDHSMTSKQCKEMMTTHACRPRPLLRRALLTVLALTLPVAAARATQADDERIERQCVHSLALFMQYARNIYHNAGENGEGLPTAYFRANSAGKSNEDGVRTNLDIAMVAAFLHHYNTPLPMAQRTGLPDSLANEHLAMMALPCLRYAYSTHQTARLQKCSDGRYWGTWSEQKDGKREWHHQWESSLWTLSLALTAHFLDDQLDDRDRQHIRRLVAEEADFQLSRPVPTGHKGDTKAEENGWEANVLACAVALYPDHEHAAQWEDAMRRYAFNCYTVRADQNDDTMVDGKPAKEWYVGQNLYDDFTLQNHNYFHTSYQNVVMQEQAECLVALQLLSKGRPQTGYQNSVFTWHWQEVWQQVLAQLALSDGELAMPNGNDWSMFLYDQLPAYAAMATVMRNGDALMLEQRCLEQLLLRQQTTRDGSFLLNSDIGPRRMGVTAHRVMMTYWLHKLFGTSKANTWEDFQQRHRKAVYFPSQRLVRSMSKSRFACFSVSEGLQSCTGVIVPCRQENSKVFIPYRQGFGGNMMGLPKQMPEVLQMEADGEQWCVWGRADGQPFAVWATPGNAVLVVGRPVMMAVSMDIFTREVRRDKRGAAWICIDDAVAVVAPGAEGRFSMSKAQTVQSIGTALLTSEVNPEKPAVVYYSNVSDGETELLAGKVKQKTKTDKEGHRTWTVKFQDPDGTQYEMVFDDRGNAPKRTIGATGLMSRVKKAVNL